MGLARLRTEATVETPVRIMLVDDSVVARAVIARIVEGMAHHRIVAAVGGVVAAGQVLARERVDVILLDLNLPGVDGLAGLPMLAALAPDAAIIVLSGRCDDGSPTALHALSLGAAATIAKPASAAMNAGFADRLEHAIDVALRRQPGTRACAFDVVAIGASTGGIHALAPLLAAIPIDDPVPILVTQHLPAAFTDYFARQLASMSGRPVDIGDDSLRVRRGRIILAPGDAHLRVVATTEGAAIRLDRTPQPSGCLPSVDPMFQSAARVFGSRTLGIVLSGMGRDGCRGAMHIHAAGGIVAAQDQGSSVVWGMPGAVVDAGIARVIGTPGELGAFVTRGRRPA
ncbi:chemotaxis protein CheB [Sphingomonas silueang]|uniref:chemotaxis protein CheB n=1 Tax=Sphingomonas silueang TaxID=3156617 RepID=UPI0032B5CF6F